MNSFKNKVVAVVEQALPATLLAQVDVNKLLEVPPDPQFGDYAFPTFSLARHMRKAPALIAQELAAAIPTTSWLDEVKAVGGYLNFTINKAEMAQVVLQRVFTEGNRYGACAMGDGQSVVIDFSSPNIAKPFAVGLIRTTVLGHALSRLFSFCGYKVERVNHLGDWGTQNGKWIVGWRLWGDEAKLQENPIKELLRLYVRFHQEAEENPQLEDEARQAFRQLEEGDPEAYALWSRFRALSIEEFKRVYARMGIEFDSYAGEAFYTDKMDKVVDMLKSKGLLVQSEGAGVVNLGDDLPPCLILRSDGATLYPTRDLAAALYRWQQYEPVHVLYVVDVRQSLHFKQVFGVLAKAGCDWVDRYEHIAFGFIKFGDEVMATRKGNVIILEDVLDEAAARALAIMQERNPQLPNKEAIAQDVGIGAIIFRFLMYNRLKDISFDWESALNFEGDTGPYVQYTHARASSVLRKAGVQLKMDKLNIGLLNAAEEVALLREIERFPAVVVECVEARDPAGLAHHLLELCRAFNAFYHVHRVVGSESMHERLALVAATRTVIANGLHLLGLAAPEEM